MFDVSQAEVLRVSRLVPQAIPDTQPAIVRGTHRQEKFVMSLVRKQYALLDEGSYWLTHNAQTGIVTSLLGTAFSQTTLSPVLHLINTDAPGGKSICLDYLNLICTIAGAAGASLTNLLFAWSMDQGDRYTSGGTDLTASPASGGGTLNPNTGISKRNSVLQAYFGALTLAAASARARIIVPQRLLRVQNSGTAMCVAQDECHMTFGGVERGQSAIVDLTTAKTVAYREIFNLPGLEIAPGHNATLHMWSPGAALTTGITFLPELAHWER